MFACTNKSVPETKRERYKQIAVYWFCSLPAMAPWSLWLLPFKAPPHVPMWRRPPLLGRRAKSAPGTLRGPISFGTAPWAWWRRRWRPPLRTRGPTSPWRAKHAAFHHSAPFHTPDLAHDHLADHPPKPLLRALLARLHELFSFFVFTLARQLLGGLLHSPAHSREAAVGSPARSLLACAFPALTWLLNFFLFFRGGHGSLLRFFSGTHLGK